MVTMTPEERERQRRLFELRNLELRNSPRPAPAPVTPKMSIPQEDYNRGLIGNGKYALKNGGRAHFDGGGAAAAPSGLANSSPASAAPSSGGDPTTTYLSSLYQNLLGRAPDAGGLSYWKGQMSDGMPTSDVLGNFVNSNEFQQDYKTNPNNAITQLYQESLGRAPDTDGFNYWLDKAKGGMSLGDMYNNFENSAEGKNVNQITNDYLDYTGLMPTQAQIAASQAQIAGGKNVDDYISNTPEALRYYRNNYVNDVLGRDITDAENSQWQSYLDNKTLTDQQIENQFSSSPEAVSRFIKNEYNNYFGRDPLQSETDVWANALASGTTRKALDDTLYANPYAKQYLTDQTIKGLYETYTGNDPTADQLAAGRAQLGTDSNISDFIQKAFPDQIASPDEYDVASNSRYIPPKPTAKTRDLWSQVQSFAGDTKQKIDNFLKFIYSGESDGGRDPYNVVRSHGHPVYDASQVLGKDLGQFTIGDILNFQKQHIIDAAGAPQFINKTLNYLVQKYGIDTNMLYNQDTQDKLSTLLMLEQPQMRDFVTGKTTSLKTGVIGTAHNWASAPMPNGRTLYGGNNGARYPVSKLEDALRPMNGAITIAPREFSVENAYPRIEGGQDNSPSANGSDTSNTAGVYNIGGMNANDALSQQNFYNRYLYDGLENGYYNPGTGTIDFNGSSGSVTTPGGGSTSDGTNMVPITKTITTPGTTSTLESGGKTISYEVPGTTKTIITGYQPKYEAAGFQSSSDYVEAMDAGYKSASSFYADQTAQAAGWQSAAEEQQALSDGFDNPTEFETAQAYQGVPDPVYTQGAIWNETNGYTPDWLRAFFGDSWNPEGGLGNRGGSVEAITKDAHKEALKRLSTARDRWGFNNGGGVQYQGPRKSYALEGAVDSDPSDDDRYKLPLLARAPEQAQMGVVDRNVSRPSSNASDFIAHELRADGQQLPQSDNAAGLKTGQRAGLFFAGLAPGAGATSAAGYFPSVDHEGGYEPSFKQNLKEGNYFTAGLQGLGAVGDAAYAAPFVGPLVGTALKAPLAAKLAMTAAPMFRGASREGEAANVVDRLIGKAPEMTKTQSQAAMKTAWEQGQGNTDLYKNWQHQWNMEEGNKFKSAPQPQQPKVAPPEPENDYTRLANPAGFYSRGHEAAMTVLPEQPKTWQEMFALLSNPQKGKVKKEEMKWAGLDQDAFPPNQKVSREEIAKRFADNFPQTDVKWQRTFNRDAENAAIDAVVEAKDRKQDAVSAFNRAFQHHFGDMENRPSISDALFEVGNSDHTPESFDKFLQSTLPENLHEPARAAQQAAQDHRKASEYHENNFTNEYGDPQWKQYTHEGGDNYSIAAMTLPYNKGNRTLHPEAEAHFEPQMVEAYENWNNNIKLRRQAEDNYKEVTSQFWEQPHVKDEIIPKFAEDLYQGYGNDAGGFRELEPRIQQSYIDRAEDNYKRLMPENKFKLVSRYLSPMKAEDMVDAYKNYRIGAYRELKDAERATNHSYTKIEQLKAERLAMSERLHPKVPEYTTQHFQHTSHLGDEIHNPIVHNRFKDRVGPDGERILSHEENQSDIGQLGEEHGFIDPQVSAQSKALQEQLDRMIKEHQDNIHFFERQMETASAPIQAEKQRLLADADKELRASKQSKSDIDKYNAIAERIFAEINANPAFDEARANMAEVANARHEAVQEYKARTKPISDKLASLPRNDGQYPLYPHVKNTDDWMEQGVKQALSHAIENNYDKIFVMGGNEQARRYQNGLRQAVDNIRWENPNAKVPDLTPEQRVELEGFLTGRQNAASLHYYDRSGLTYPDLGARERGAINHQIVQESPEYASLLPYHAESGRGAYIGRYATEKEAADAATLAGRVWHDPKLIDGRYGRVDKPSVHRSVYATPKNGRNEHRFDIDEDGNIIASSLGHSGLANKKVKDIAGAQLAKRIMAEKSGEQAMDDFVMNSDGYVQHYEQNMPAKYREMISKHLGVEPKIEAGKLREKAPDISGEPFIKRRDDGQGWAVGGGGSPTYYFQDESAARRRFSDLSYRHTNEMAGSADRLQQRPIEEIEQLIPGYTGMDSLARRNAATDYVVDNLNKPKIGPHGTTIHITPEMREAYHRIKQNKGAVFPAYKKGGTVGNSNDSDAMKALTNLTRRAG